MKPKITLSLLLFFAFFFNRVQAQELNCNLQVNISQIQTSDKKIFETLQKSLYQFVNGRRWSNFNIAQAEKVECGITLNIQERDIQSNVIKATLSVQARRPVYNSSYGTSTINFVDRDFTFVYSEFDPLDYSDNNVGTNLTATIAYYCYMILGIHFDSFGLGGGRLFFEKAQNVVNLAQGFSEQGWKSNETKELNRYWLADSFNNGNYQVIHTIIYEYTRLGLDNMYDNPELARKNIMIALERVKELNQLKSSLPCKQIFMESKVEEIVNIFSPVGNPEKQKVIGILTDIDPSNMSKYQAILNSKNTSR